MSSNLERRYRWLLRVLPGWYRARREEEMVGIFLAGRGDELDLEHGWPGWGEAFATAALAVRVRLRAGGAAGDGVRLVALGGLVGHLVLAAQGAVSAVRFGGAAEVWFTGLVAAAFAAAVTGRLAWARWLSAAVAVLGLVAAVGSAAWWAQVPAWVTAVAVGLGLHREAPPVPGSRWSVIAVTVVVVGGAVALAVPLSPVVWWGAWVVTTAVVVALRPWSVAPAGGSATSG